MKHLFLSLLLVITGTAFASELDEAGALAVLQKLDASKASDAELFDAAAACRRLTVIGTEKSVDVLEPLLTDPKLGSYARTALQNIGGEKSEAALKKHPAKTDNASPVSENLMKAGIGKCFILNGDEKSLDMFVNMLTSDDRIMFNAALAAFREFPDGKIVDVMAKEQAGLKPERRVAAIRSMLDINLGWQLPQPIVKAAASEADPDVRAAALAVLGRCVEAETVLILFNALGEENKTVADAAFEALATTKSPVENLIVTNLGNTNPKVREACVRLVGQRRITSAQEVLWNSDPVQLGRSADFYRAFGRIADEKGFELLLQKLDRLADVDSVNAAKEGALVACRLAADRKKYVEILNRNNNRLQWLQLELLAAVGGEDALKSIADIARAGEWTDQATKILGEWTGAEVAPVLLELSASLTEEKYKVRTLRGFLRAVRQFEMPREEKKKLCEKALDIAPREEEKKLVRDVLSKL